MAQFLGGSAYAMANQTADGYVTMTPAVLKRFNRGELTQIQFELQKILTALRGSQPTGDDTAALQTYHHKMGRIRSAMLILQNQLSLKK
jgi:hypothetical protein